jgi:acyl-coenzyme A synthetase/AMP-(fatty) acid ligase
MAGEYNLAAMVIDRARRFPDRVALKGPADNVSYPHLVNLIFSFALRMKRHGVGRGSCVAIDTDNAFIAIAAALATSLLGCRWVQGTPPAITSNVLGLTHVVHSGAWPASAGANFLKVTQGWLEPVSKEEADSARFAGFASPQDVWMIAQSSGTTGTSKFMAISEANAWTRMEIDLPDLRGEIPVVCSLQHPIALGSIFNICRVLARGGTFLFVRDYRFWTENGANYVIGSPAQYSGMFQRTPKPARPEIQLALLAGGPILPTFLDVAFDYFETVANTYGSTEAAIICTKFTHRGDQRGDRVCLGRPAPGSVLEIIDANDRPVPAGTEGIVRLRTPWQVPGYMGDPETTAATFKNGWFYPGDLGYLSDEGELYIVGRTNDQLNIGGAKLNPAIVDEVIQETAGVADGICFAEPDQQGVIELSAVVSLKQGADSAAVAAALRERIGKRIGPDMAPRRIYLSSYIPRNANGKATRHLAIEAVRGLRPV